MDDENGFPQFRVVETVDREVDAADNEDDAIFRTYLVSRAGDRIGLELTLAQLREFVRTANEFLKALAGGSRVN